MPSDLVISVKQIGSYPLLNPITGTEMLLVQSGGLGGPYYSVQMSQMIVNTLANFEGPIAIGVGQAPADGNPDTVFSGDLALTLGALGVAFNAYAFAGGGQSGFKYWQNGFAGAFFQDPTSGGFAWQTAPTGAAGSPIYSTAGGPSLFTTAMTVSPAGYLQVAQTLLVARAPTIPLEVATKGYVDGLTGPTNVVTSWNTRTGAVTLSLLDITTAGGAGIQSPTFTGVPQAPTPPLGTNSNQIATTAWVLNQISSVTAGVVSWNGRSGVVTMTPADITNSGGLTQIAANASFLALAGGTMTGPITMTAAANQNMEVPVLGQVGARVGASTPPATPAPLSGNLWWDSVGAQLYAWTGAQWVIAVNPPIPDTSSFLRLSGGTMTGPLQIINSVLTISGSTSYEVINQTGAALPPLASSGTTYTQPALWLAALSYNDLMIDSWSTLNGGSIQFRCQGGTPSAPVATPNTNIGGLNFNAWTGSAWGTGGASIGAWTGAAWTATSQPGNISFYGTPSNATAQFGMFVMTPVGHTSDAALTIQPSGPNVANATALYATVTQNGGVIANFTTPIATDCKLQLNQGASVGGASSQWQLSAQGYSAQGWFYIYYAGSGPVFTGIGIDTQGNCYSTHGTWSAFSDPRLKTSIEDYTTGLDAIRQLQPIKFQYTGEAHTIAGMDELGLDATALKTIMPEICGTAKVRRHEDDDVDLDYDTIRSGHLVYALINAVKELAAKVDALEAKGAA